MVITMHAFKTLCQKNLASLPGLHYQQWLFCFLALMMVAVTLLTGCEPGGFPTIENQRDNGLNIFVLDVYEDGSLSEPRNYGLVPAQSTKELAGIVFARREWVYRIQAVDPSGNVAFSHDYNWYDLEKIDWKIVIPPS